MVLINYFTFVGIYVIGVNYTLCIYEVEFVSLGCVTTLFTFRDILAVAGSWSIYIMGSSNHRETAVTTCTFITILFYSNDQNPTVSIYPSIICLSVFHLSICLLSVYLSVAMFFASILMQCFFLPIVTEELYRTHKLKMCHTRLNSSTQH